jgi:Ca2+-binding EF-hand superfamily protein
VKRSGSPNETDIVPGHGLKRSGIQAGHGKDTQMTMKKQVSALVIGALVATGAASSVAAQDGSQRSERRAQMFAQLDTDGNGVVSAEEFANPPSRFEIADADGDGVLSAEELTAMGQHRAEQRVAQMLERFDANEDGMLSEEELASRRGASRMFERLDADDDGSISAEEFAEMRMLRRGGFWGKRHGNN